jgi:hypothetical protein
VAEIRAQLAPDTPVEVWFQDEMRVGQKNKLTYRWARKGSRPRAAHDQRTQSTYLFGAVCPERGAGAALVLPACNTEAMQLHLDEIASKIAPGAHAILLLDQAGWHGAKALKVPNNISLLQPPPRAPELARRSRKYSHAQTQEAPSPQGHPAVHVGPSDDGGPESLIEEQGEYLELTESGPISCKRLGRRART